MRAAYIKRPIYIDRIKPFIGKPIIKVLTGQRRVGKSYLMLQLIDEIKLLNPEANVIYINIELHEFDSIRTNEALYTYIDALLVSGIQNFLLIDEIQEVKSFELCLRSLLAESKCDIVVTGSNAQMLSGELATTLSGRYIQFPVYSLSYSEFLRFHTLENSSESLVKFLKFGGMPYLINTGLDQNVVFEYLKNVNSTILLKDVVARENIRNVSFLENLTVYLADNVGSIFSAFNISKYLKSQQQNVPTQTVLNYLRALTNAYYVHKVQRANVNGLKIFEVGEKYYFEDLGLRNAIRYFDYKGDINKLMENAVYLHLKRYNYNVFVGKIGEKEIDFMAERNGGRIYIQVTYMLFDQKTADREFGNLLLIEDNYPKYVITMDEISAGSDFKGIRQLNLREFLIME
ncbi:MAG: ATP-binding protein, partial [Bacteroidetes bacterium]|nr:ATP-binding protein [Bacteroidota bacterium]